MGDPPGVFQKSRPKETPKASNDAVSGIVPSYRRKNSRRTSRFDQAKRPTTKIQRPNDLKGGIGTVWGVRGAVLRMFLKNET